MSAHRTVRRGPQRALNEATYIISSVWQELRKLTLPGRIERIWQGNAESGSKCCIQLRANALAGPHGNCFVALPNHDFIVDDDGESSLHNFMACQDVLALMYTLIEYLLPVGDWVKDIVEVELMPAEPRRFFEIYNIQGRLIRDVWHCVLRIELSRGAGRFYLDLTSAQYGFYGSPLLSERSYHTHRVRKKSPRTKFIFGHQHKDLRQEHRGRRNNTRTFFDLSYQIYGELARYAQDWEERTGTNIQDVLSDGNRTESDKLIAYINRLAKERVGHVVAANSDVFEWQQAQDTSYRLKLARQQMQDEGPNTALINTMVRAADEAVRLSKEEGRLSELQPDRDMAKQGTVASLLESGATMVKEKKLIAAEDGLGEGVPGHASTKVITALQQSREYWDFLRPVQAGGEWRLCTVRAAKE